ncbi:hypothetical protein SHKM778_67490 [Streptomyces sp. KM77-8]|uniref:HTH cro/C1-type domain-containing protein n=1 Tax=Streptomyces haneummycinicus TaxID=3074435 RepID=A0AAT9HS05_9ACTN
MRADSGGGGGTNGSEAELSDSLKTFGAVLKALREESGLTQEEFAVRVRYSAAYVAKIEQGKRFPRRTCPRGRRRSWGRSRSRSSRRRRRV